MGWLKAFIPQHLPNKRLLDILDMGTHFKISEKKIRANYRANADTISKAFSSFSAAGRKEDCMSEKYAL